MSRTSLVIGTVLICGLTLATGWLHTWVIGGQRIPDKLAAVGERLQSMPEASVGPWVFVSSEELNQSQIEMLECSGYISRTYEHESQGWRIYVFVGAGPHGPTSVHTPEVCYPANDFEQLADPKVFSVTDNKGQRHQLWGLDLRSNDAASQILRTAYAWSPNGKWVAPSQPRIAFIGEPYLYKFQIAIPVDETAETGQVDPRTEFLKDFLPVLQQYVIDREKS